MTQPAFTPLMLQLDEIQGETKNRLGNFIYGVRIKHEAI